MRRPPAEAKRGDLIARLDGLRPEARKALAGASAPFRLARGDRFLSAGEPIATVFFIAQGLAATLARTPDGAAAAGLVGRGGVVGHWALLGATSAGCDAVALVATSGRAVDRPALDGAAAADPELGAALRSYALERFAESERLCACAALHSIERRIAGWLVRAAQIAPDGPIAVTHRQLSELLGVRRASVTTSLHLMEGERALRCRRGAIEIRDRDRLEAHACACLRPASPQEASIT